MDFVERENLSKIKAILLGTLLLLFEGDRDI
jgi:hypothetical protein